VATIEVNHRPTSAERRDASVDVLVHKGLTVHAETLEDRVAPWQASELGLRKGTDLGPANNVQAVRSFVIGEQASSPAFRLGQLDSVQDLREELVLSFEERRGIAKTARRTGNAGDVDLFHILTHT
jgi:hypothetical protein